ncbi:MAG TPA: hypothetical protein VFH47_09280, partial [Candidatus Thermoplasmatota archaeon]|nr:hypothetical protein [Candidatus Thermoplasmatota archaeon]
MPRAAWLPALLVLLALPAAAFPVVEVQAPARAEDAAATACLPPCGYIIPVLSLEFPDKPACREAGDDCLALPPPEGSVRLEGLLRWHWDVSQDGIYPGDPNQPIVVSFAGTGTNPQAIQVRVEPATVTITAADLADPQRLRTDASDPAAMRVVYEFLQPITVVIERGTQPFLP